MIYCPYCGAENIEGVDVCAQCGQSLWDMHLAPPKSEVEKSLLMDRLSKLNPKAPIVVPQTMTVKEVLNFLIDKGIGSVFVSNGDQIVGVFTERDAYMRLNVDAPNHYQRPISDFMTQNPKSLADDSKIAFAVRMMDQGEYRHVLVVDSLGKPTGVTSVRDILRYLSDRVSPASS